MQLTTQQQYVLDKIKEFMENDSSVFILRGYAGTGKTTIVKEIVNYIKQLRNIVLMAPVGRAAQVLKAKTGYAASTIHKAIYNKAEFMVKNVEDVANSEFKLHFPIRQSSGSIVAIVDEASMLCSRKMTQELFEFGSDNLMDDLLTFVRPSFGGKVIFVGDPAQLPPIGESVSQALNADFFCEKGLKVMQFELKEVLRQTENSIILKNAMRIRELLSEQKRNHLIFEEKENDVEIISTEEILPKYMKTRERIGNDNCVVICYSNKIASKYNKEIRKILYGEDNSSLKEGDMLLVVQNNYLLDIMNGEFVSVSYVGEIFQQSAPVYVEEGGSKIKKIITLQFQYIKIADSIGVQKDCLLLLNLLNGDAPTIDIDSQKALYINFRMRNSHLEQAVEPFVSALLKDPYYNCLKAKYGYAVTGHKCQGGEWDKVFVDYTGRTGLSDDCLRWGYTATTRARKTLYVANLPHITPFYKFRIESIQQCSRMNEECRILSNVKSPFHNDSKPSYLHAKCKCIMDNMEGAPYKIVEVISKPYQEIYNIQTPIGVERFDIRYRKGGIFMPAVPQMRTENSVIICQMLDDERAMPLIFNYSPSDLVRCQLYDLICSSCDGCDIQITNVVEHMEDYSVMYYFRTTSLSYIKIYIDKSGYVTYAKPMSWLGEKDEKLIKLIEEIQKHFDNGNNN